MFVMKLRSVDFIINEYFILFYILVKLIGKFDHTNLASAIILWNRLLKNYSPDCLYGYTIGPRYRVAMPKVTIPKVAIPKFAILN